ncbi:MAG: hypothetical protein P4L66_07900 [Acetobacteraceae bacterium]|nr:hypothetical protein [Acetobacteraceae bacterium]
MNRRSTKFLVLAGLTTAALFTPQGGARAQTPSTVHPMPQSLINEHAEDFEKLEILSKRPGKVGEIARKAVALFKRHEATEKDYIMPPLTLLPSLADGQVTPDMAWAIAMTDKVRANRELIFQQHTEMTDILSELVVAAEAAHDQDAKEFAEAAAGDSLNDVEILEPMVLVLGDYLKMKLAALPK